MPNLTAIILTYNEERNITACLESLQGLNAEIFIVDSGSTDATLEICGRYTANIFSHPFSNYGAQRNWALANLPVKTDWIINLDADHRLTPGLREELNQKFAQPVEADIKGFMVSRRTIFMGKWIRFGGHYPTYHAIIFRRGFGACEDKLYDQHFKVNGKTVPLKHDVIDIITDSIDTFVERHNNWSTLEAQYQFENQQAGKDGLIKGKFWGNPMERRRYVKERYERFPLFVRPMLYFFIRYFIKLGFLDGRTGFTFHFLQGFWFRFIIDVKINELRKRHEQAKK